jgi:hypothetical protein
MPAKDPLIYLMHIRDCCRRIAEYVAASGAEWTSNPLDGYEYVRPQLIREMAEQDAPALLAHCLRLLGKDEPEA